VGSGYTTFVNGSVLTDAQLNGYLMQQALVTCTSGTRPGSPTTGQPIYETDTGLIRVWNGTIWFCPVNPDYTSITPTFYSNNTAGTAIAGGSVSVSYAKYSKVNTRCHYFGHAAINVTTASGFGISLPFPSPIRTFSMHSVYLTGNLGNSNYAQSVGIGFIPPISAPYNRFSPVDRANTQLNIITSGDAVMWNITYETV
jgi:hypothetical protein